MLLAKQLRKPVSYIMLSKISLKILSQITNEARLDDI